MRTAMKRILVTVLAIICVATLASCAVKPQLNLEDAEKNLKKEGYTVFLTESDMAHVEDVLTATDGKENTVTITEFEEETTAKLYCNTQETKRDNEIAEIKAEIKYYKHLLKEYKDELGEVTTKAYKEKVKSLEEEIKNIKDERVVGRNGAYVWVGTKKAIRATK